MEEKNEITLENLLNEYNKYILSRLINKEYDFNILREKVKKISLITDFIKYEDKMTNSEVAREIEKFIQDTTKGKIFKVE